MADIQHINIPEAQLHEAKGASTSTTGQVLTSTGGAAAFTTPAPTISQGIYDYNDLATASSPIALTVANTQYELTNDGLGPFTNLNYTLADLANVWNVSTDRFSFNGGSALKLGDTVDIRFDVEFTTGTTNTDINLILELGIGGTPYQLTIVADKDHSSAGSYQEVHMFSVYMGDANTLNNPGRVLASASKTGTTVKVNGWFIRALHNNP
jgi:hypothetical protein